MRGICGQESGKDAGEGHEGLAHKENNQDYFIQDLLFLNSLHIPVPQPNSYHRLMNRSTLCLQHLSSSLFPRHGYQTRLMVSSKDSAESFKDFDAPGVKHIGTFSHVATVFAVHTSRPSR